MKPKTVTIKLAFELVVGKPSIRRRCAPIIASYYYQELQNVLGAFLKQTLSIFFYLQKVLLPEIQILLRVNSSLYMSLRTNGYDREAAAAVQRMISCHLLIAAGSSRQRPGVRTRVHESVATPRNDDDVVRCSGISRLQAATDNGRSG